MRSSTGGKLPAATKVANWGASLKEVGYWLSFVITTGPSRVPISAAPMGASLEGAGAAGAGAAGAGAAGTGAAGAGATGAGSSDAEPHATSNNATKIAITGIKARMYLLFKDEPPIFPPPVILVETSVYINISNITF